MRVAIQEPFFDFFNLGNLWNGYVIEFVRQFNPVIYQTGWRAKLGRGRRIRRELLKLGLNPNHFEFAFSVASLNRMADVLLCFRQLPCLPRYRPPKGFRGMKIWHTMEAFASPGACNEAFIEGGVDCLMANGQQDEYCSLYRKCYPGFVGKVIPVPFGFAPRFENRVPFGQRSPKALGFGAINLVDPSEGRCSSDPNYVHYEWVQHFRSERFTQSWRRQLLEHEEQLRDVLDCQFPRYPEQSSYKADAVAALNGHMLFVNDESISPFAPGRTYEGTACGAAMISSDHACFRDLGFIDEVNCLMHRRFDIAEFRKKARRYLASPVELQTIAQAGTQMVREKYSHSAVARLLYGEIKKRWDGR